MLEPAEVVILRVMPETAKVIIVSIMAETAEVVKFTTTCGILVARYAHPLVDGIDTTIF